MAGKYRKLSPRQKQVLQLIDSGMTQKAISEKLGITGKSVQDCLTYAKDKMVANSVEEAIKNAKADGQI